MSELNLDILQEAGAFAGEPIKVNIVHPNTKEPFEVWVKQQNVGDSLRILDLVEKDRLNSLEPLWAAMASCILNKKLEPVLTLEQIKAMKKDSEWYSQLLEAYLEVNGDKKKE